MRATKKPMTATTSDDNNNSTESSGDNIKTRWKFGNKTATVTKKSSAITTHITQAAKHCVWLGHGKMGVLPHYSINKNGGEIGAIKCTFRIKYSKIFK